MLFSLTMLVPALIAGATADGTERVFLGAFAITWLSGLVLWYPVRAEQGELRTRDGFLITALFWLVLGLFGALPFMLSSLPHLSLTDAIFESISGLTTTGATVISGLDALPASILYYRQQLQWLGGIGIIVIAVAILPMLGIGGMQMYRAETPGPVKESKLTPRITGTAKALFFIYLVLTVVCAIAYLLAGMSPFDAISHSFSTVAIGGFSTHDASIGYFDSPAIMIICMVFMLLSSLNFALHYFCWRHRSISHYLEDSESRFFLAAVAITLIVACSALVAYGHYDSTQAWLHGSFQVISIATTTGFATTDFSLWPSFIPIMLLLFAFMRGCAGSTAGGMKVIRVLLITKQGLREIKQLIHPNAVIPIKLGTRTVPDRVVMAVWSFFSIYVIAFMVGLVLLLATGLDFISSFSAIAAAQNNLGPGLGEVAVNYGAVNPFAKLVLCAYMLLGRLEIFTLLVLFSPAFWRR